MAEELKKESPTLEEGKPAQKEAKNDEEIQALLSTLEKVGVRTPQHLEGIAANAREFGNVSNLLGQERQHRMELEKRLSELETKPKQRDSFDYSAAETSPVDLEAVIAKAVRRENEVRDAKILEVQKRQFQAWTAIQSDADYNHVKPVWEEKLKDPNFVYQINMGSVDPVREYQETVRDFYKGLAMQAKTVIEQYKGKTVNPPHMETGERSSGNLVSEGQGEQPEVLKKFNQLKQKAAKGGTLSSEEELELARIATFGLFPTSPGPPPKK
jgi:hypothetical protein